MNWPNWHGSLEKIYLLHFVDGAAYSLYGRGEWDASIPLDKGSRLMDARARPPDARHTPDARSAANGTQSSHGAQLPEDGASILDVFYAVNSNNGEREEQEGTPDVGWNAFRRGLTMRERTADDAISEARRQPCGILPNVVSAHSGLGWVDSRMREMEREAFRELGLEEREGK